MTATARLLIALGAAAAALAGLAPAASAAPSCADTELWARPGIERRHWIECAVPGTAVVTSGPDRAARWALWNSASDIAFDYRPDDTDAPVTDTVELSLGRGRTITLTIHIVPRAQNTAPRCEPVRFGERTDGLSPADVYLPVRCRDAERDTIVLHATGPGAFASPQVEQPGGDAFGRLDAIWYRTAAASGTETATYWAVDELGARSQDAPITVELGPHADRPVECFLTTGHPYELAMRAGVPRNFGVHCLDRDDDPFTLRLGTPPRRGSLTTFAPSSDRRVDITYVPGSASTLADELTVVAETATSAITYPIRLRRAGPDEDTSPICLHPNPATLGAVPLNVATTCIDMEGDPVQAGISRPPLFGTADPPVVVSGGFGEQHVRVRYTPKPGSIWNDRVGVTVADFGELLFWLSGPPLPPHPVVPPVTRGERTPAARAGAALGVDEVRLVRRVGVARIYAPKRGLRRVGGRPALAVLCTRRCRVHARTPYAHGQRIVVRPGRVGVITMPWGALADRTMTRLRFALGIRAKGRATRRTTVRLRVGR